MYSIYALLNKINKKVYIGQTNNLKRRFSRHKYEAFTKNNKKPLYNSIRKYGIENFIIIELALYMKEEIDDAEQFWIELLESNNLIYGYNLTNGGQLKNKHIKTNHNKKRTSPMLGKYHSIKTKKKMSQNKLNEQNSFYGKKHSEESKLLMSENQNRKHFGNTNHFYGKSFKGENNAFSKLNNEIVIEARLLYAQGKTFVELSKKYNVSESSISRAIRGITWNHI